jgi:hypothetical protein
MRPAHWPEHRLLEPEAEPSGRPEMLVREARKANQLVATLRCLRDEDGYAVECEAYRAGALPGSPEHRSYRFREREDAELFVHEAARALEYLGCSVGEPDGSPASALGHR